MNVESVDLQAVGAELAAEAAAASSGRASRVVVHGEHQRALLLALHEGAALADHEAPKAASLQIVRGQADLTVDDQRWPLPAGSLVAIPPVRHGLVAVGPCVVLLTVVL